MKEITCPIPQARRGVQLITSSFYAVMAAAEMGRQRDILLMEQAPPTGQEDHRGPHVRPGPKSRRWAEWQGPGLLYKEMG